MDDPTGLFSALRTAEAFQDLTLEQFETVSGELSLLSLPAGQVLYRQDTPGESLAVLLAGRLRVELSHPDGRQTLIDELGPGDTSGASSLLIGHRHSASVLAGPSGQPESQVLLLSKAGFEPRPF